MTRWLRSTVLCGALLAHSAADAQRAKPPSGECPARPADCQITTQVFHFGSAEMTASTRPVYAHTIVGVTCTRTAANGTNVDVTFELQALPPDPERQMRDRELQFLRYNIFLDAARTRRWGDGTQGTEVLTGSLFLDDRNRVGSLVFPIYGRVDGGQIVFPGSFLGVVLNRLNYTTSCR